MPFPFEFVLFGVMLLGVALLHRHTLQVAAFGLLLITAYKLVFADFHGVPGAAGLVDQLAGEWVLLALRKR